MNPKKIKNRQNQEIGKNRENAGSVIPVFLMRLFNRQDILDNYQFLFLVDIVKHRITPGDVKPVDYNPSAEDQFLLIPPVTRERILLQPFQGSPDNAAGLIRQTFDLLSQLSQRISRNVNP